jgi:hypothetical protein
VVSFGRANFWLDLDLVGIAIHSCLGGNGIDLRISHIRDRTFKISVVSKAAGFMIYNLKSFSCKSFHCFFHLWGFGAPNRQREFNNWITEQSRDWQIVSRRKSPLIGANAIAVATGRSYAEVARDQHNDLNSADHMHASRSPSNSNHRPSDLALRRPTLLLRSTAAPAESGMGRPLALDA